VFGTVEKRTFTQNLSLKKVTDYLYAVPYDLHHTSKNFNRKSAESKDND